MKNTLKEIIAGYQSRPFPKGHDRHLDVPLHSNKIISLIGTRRSGKTYIMYQKIQELLHEGVSRENIIFINFEDERLRLDATNLDLILQAYRELYPRRSLQDCYFFFDEIQNVDGWERFVRRIYDTETQNIFVAGSNSKLLSTEIATALRGRTLSYEVYPLSFAEYLTFKKIEFKPHDPKSKAAVIKAFQIFLLVGGFPEIVKEDRQEVRNKMLQEYFNVMIFRDLVERFNMGNVSVLKYFIKKIFNSVTTTISVNKIYNDLRSNKYEVSKNYLYESFERINDIYLIRKLNKFDFSEIKQEKSDKKAYAIDHGLLSAINFQFSEDKGKRLENLVALEFFKKGLSPMYYKQLKACDFVIEQKGEFTPIQVSYTMQDDSTRQRELDGLAAACKFLKVKKGLILTFDQSESIQHKGFDMEVMPCWTYFLDTSVS